MGREDTAHLRKWHCRTKKISGNLESVGDRGLMLYYEETPRGRLFFYPWHTIERVEKVRD